MAAPTWERYSRSPSPTTKTEPELSITSDAVEEGDSALFEVTLNAESAREVTVSYVTEDVTATAGAEYDYTALPSTTLTFVAGEMAKTLTVATE